MLYPLYTHTGRLIHEELLREYWSVSGNGILVDCDLDIQKAHPVRAVYYNRRNGLVFVENRDGHLHINDDRVGLQDLAQPWYGDRNFDELYHSTVGGSRMILADAIHRVSNVLHPNILWGLACNPHMIPEAWRSRDVRAVHFYGAVVEGYSGVSALALMWYRDAWYLNEASPQRLAHLGELRGHKLAVIETERAK